MKKKVKLKKALGLFELTVMGIGIILGAGIYALIGKAAGIAGYNLWVSFILGAFLAGLTALSYAELSSIYPKAGAEFDYCRKPLNEKIAFVIGWLIIIGSAFSAAAISIAFAGYFNALTGLNEQLTAILLLILIAFILFKGIKETALIAIIATVIEVIGLLIIIFIGIPFFNLNNLIQKLSFGAFPAIMSASALIFFAYLGFEEIVKLAEETKQARKLMPTALLIALIITTILYVLTAISAVNIIAPETLSNLNAPLTEVAKQAFNPEAGILLAIIALFSTFNTVLLILLGATRITFGIARAGLMPKSIALIHEKTRTPVNAIILISLISILLIFIGKIELLANITTFTIFITFITINIALIKLRIKNPEIKKEFRIPGNIKNIPITAVTAIIVCIIMILSQKPIIWIAGIILILIGLLLFKLVKKNN